jgi:lysophospholipase L1-like esterase
MSLTAQQQFLIDFRLDQMPALMGLNIPDDVAAEMLGIPSDEFNSEVQKVVSEMQGAAQQLLAEPDVAYALASWELAPATSLLFVGDSITALRKSYAEIFNVMLQRARSDVHLTVNNLAQSGFTSAAALQDTYTAYLIKNPDWVFILLGTNDAQHVEGIGGRTLVSLNEYRDNLRAIVNAFQQHTRARIIQITPPPLIEKTANATYGGLKIAYSNATVSQYADTARALARELSIPCVDLFEVFGANADLSKFGPDGLHPNLAGQMEIVRALSKTVTKPREQKNGD